MKLETGEGDNEFFVLRFECFIPNIVVVGYYGIIEGQFKPDTIKSMQAELFAVVKKYLDEGDQILWCGDFNNHVGNNCGISNNPGGVSIGGRGLIDFVKDEGMIIANERDPTHTHIDKSSKTSKILDFLICSNDVQLDHFEVDKTLDWTPYRTRKVKGGFKRTYTDHVGVYWEVTSLKTSNYNHKTVSWNFNKFGGNEKYAYLTDMFAGQIISKIEETRENPSQESVNKLWKFIKNGIEDIKRDAYGKISRSKTQAKKFSEAQIWRKKTKDIFFPGQVNCNIMLNTIKR